MTAATARLARITAIWQRAAPVLTSTWLVGTLIALAAWNVGVRSPSVGLDWSWVVGLYMAAHHGLDFGSQVVWTYGPLGFLALPALIYPGLAAISFLYLSGLLVALCVSLVWTVRHAFNLTVAVVVVYVTVAALHGPEIPIALTAVWCLAALAPDPPGYARHVVAIGGGAFSAIECLVKLSVGPTILLMCAATLAALTTRSRDLPRFAASALVAFAALWFATGQGVGNLTDYIGSARQIVTGYSQAMGIDDQPHWYVFAGLELIVMLTAWSIICAAPGPRRAAAGAVMALAAFEVFKEGVVRFDSAHAAILFGTPALLTLAVPWRSALAPAGLVTLLLAGGLAIHVEAVSADQVLNPVPRVSDFGSSIRLVASPGRLDQESADARSDLASGYGLDPKTLALLRGHPVDVAPWEAAVAWAYGLEWRPEPVFQAYNAYTTALDRDNARFLASAPPRQRVLRLALTGPGEGLAIDGRNPSWDPPLANVAMLCHYMPLRTTAHWQVLGRRPDRCGRPRFLASVNTEYRRGVRVPAAPPGTAVVAKIHGAGVSGLEGLQTFFFRSNFRYANVNGTRVYRLVPGTAADGLLMSVPKRADFPGRLFSLSPDVQRLRLTGTSGDLRIDFYALPIRSLTRSAR